MILCAHNLHNIFNHGCNQIFYIDQYIEHWGALIEEELHFNKTERKNGKYIYIQLQKCAQLKKMMLWDSKDEKQWNTIGITSINSSVILSFQRTAVESGNRFNKIYRLSHLLFELSTDLVQEQISPFTLLWANTSHLDTKVQKQIFWMHYWQQHHYYLGYLIRQSASMDLKTYCVTHLWSYLWIIHLFKLDNIIYLYADYTLLLLYYT